MNQHLGSRVPLATHPEESNEEGAGLIAHAQDNPSSREQSPFREYEAEPYESDLGYRGAAQRFDQQTSYPSQTMGYQDHQAAMPYQQQPGRALSTDDYHEVRPAVNMSVYSGRVESSVYPEDEAAAAAARQQTNSGRPRDTAQATLGAALWGQNPHQHPDGPMI